MSEEAEAASAAAGTRIWSAREQGGAWGRGPGSCRGRIPPGPAGDGGAGLWEKLRVRYSGKGVAHARTVELLGLLLLSS